VKFKNQFLYIQKSNISKVMNIFSGSANQHITGMAKGNPGD